MTVKRHLTFLSVIKELVKAVNSKTDEYLWLFLFFIFNIKNVNCKAMNINGNITETHKFKLTTWN